MKPKSFITFAVLSALTLALAGCVTGKPRVPQVTIPNGRSPATDNAPHAPMSDHASMRAGWNHGNGVLWVVLNRSAGWLPDEVEKDGSLRFKFAWWRAVPGKFTIEGRRLDASAPPLRSSHNDDSETGPFGFTPSYLYFPTEGYWEITGRIDDHPGLTFVIHVIKKAGDAKLDLPQATVPNRSSPAKANAPHAPMNDTDTLRTNFNHGNGVLWVTLPPRGEWKISDNERERDGYYRVKFPWWRGVRGQLTVDGRRLDLPAPALRYNAASIAENGDIGLNPCLLFFPTEGYWEITGHVGGKSLTFVIHVVKEVQ
jgi:hypothetical protein